jgi:hypothetical protein
MRISPLLAAALAASVSAQGQLIGLGYDPAVVNVPVILQQTLCQPGARLCPAVGMVNPLAVPWAGGAAYNGRNESMWTTDGILIVETRLRNCQPICRVPAARALGPASFAGGLEILPGPGVMYQVESLPGVAQLHRWDISVCPPVLTASCQLPLPSPQHVCGGIAIDEVNGEIFYATSVFGALGPANVVLGAPLNNPCNIVCRIPVQGCGTLVMGALRGFCFDECRQVMHLTDGNQTLSLRRAGAGPCQFAQIACCAASPNTGPYGWVGVDVEPQHAQPVGAACFGVNCVPCPNMALGTIGDPVLGNPTFQLEVTGAPVASVMAIGLSPGGCNVPGLPLLCGNWHPTLGSTFFLPSVPVGGALPCQGTATLPLPIPTNFGLCGAPLCFQGVIVCLASGSPGLALTNAVNVVLN